MRIKSVLKCRVRCYATHHWYSAYVISHTNLIVVKHLSMHCVFYELHLFTTLTFSFMLPLWFFSLWWVRLANKYMNIEIVSDFDSNKQKIYLRRFQHHMSLVITPNKIYPILRIRPIVDFSRRGDPSRLFSFSKRMLYKLEDFRIACDTYYNNVYNPKHFFLKVNADYANFWFVHPTDREFCCFCPLNFT